MGLSVTSGRFPSTVFKCSFHLCNSFSLAVSFCFFFLKVLFPLHLLSAMLIVIVYFLPSFWYIYISSSSNQTDSMKFTDSHHPSLSSIAPGRSCKLHTKLTYVNLCWSANTGMSIRECRLWFCPCFSSNAPHVLFGLFTL